MNDYRTMDKVSRKNARGTFQRDLTYNEPSLPNGGRIVYSKGKIVFVFLLFLISIAAFVSQTEITSFVYSEGFNEPFLLLYLTHGSWFVLWPLQFISIAFFKTTRKYIRHLRGYESLVPGTKWKGFRRTFASSVKAQHRNIHHTSELIAKSCSPGFKSSMPLDYQPQKHPKTYRDFFTSNSIKYILLTSIPITLILNVAGSSWYFALTLSTSNDVTAIYNCSAFTAYAFAIPLLGEKFSFLKLSSVIIAVFGVFIVTYNPAVPSDDDQSGNDKSYRFVGNVIISVGAVLYGLYEVLYKKYLCCPSSLISSRRQASMSNFAMSVIGIFNFGLFWAPLVFAHFTGLHKFNLDYSGTIWLLVGLSVLSNLLFSCSFLALTSLTSPVLSSVSSLVTILFVGITDWLLFGIQLSWTQIFGDMVVVLGFGLLIYGSWNEISEDEEDDLVIDSDAESVVSAQVSEGRR
ncbi:putative transporter [Komagataella phaffii GS115]|uniref:Uncharacterized transporter n=2 Tax=Komagataella phaffii TaxID=460519 RepID=C4QZB9_KOMPG|nr:putative transporter [Komagataella phaffii GS115]AOA60918.1 GQ67_01399T0 [Komagataella phaffii]AOA66494.1 GQ68_01415T0 [Komagataella phaffii GS115]CAY68593.1 Uncharacterized transporter [Komagataella phaffii GS115]